MTEAPKPAMDKWKCLRCGEEQEAECGKKPLRCENPICGKRGPFEALTGPYRFFDGNKFVPGRLGESIKKDFRFVTMKDNEDAYVYQDGVYQLGAEVVIKAEARKRLTDELSREGFINETVAHITETTYAERKKFDNPYTLIAVENGLLDVLTGELQPHTPDKMTTTKLPVPYNKDATCPKIMKFLSEIHHEADIPIIQEIVGYCLLKRYPFGTAFMFLGPGENGKSTELNLIEALVGEDNVANPSLQDLLYNRFAKAELYGKLVNIHADIPSTKLEKTGVFKMLTGWDTIYMERKNRDPFYGKNYAKLIYSANELPETTDLTLAFFRRWILIRFPNSFPEGDPNTDSDIIDKLTTPEELSGFLNWALEGLHRLLKQSHFTRTKTRKEVEDEWIMKTDSLRAFTNELVEVKPGTFTTKAQFYERYKKFCSDYDLMAVTMSAIGHRLPTIIPQTGESKPLVDGRQQKAWKDIYITDSTEVLPYPNSNETKISHYTGIKEKNGTKGTKGETPPPEDLGEATTLPLDIQGCPGALDILASIADGSPCPTYKIPKKANVPKQICHDTIAELDRKGYAELSEWGDTPVVKITEKGRGVLNGK